MLAPRPPTGGLDQLSQEQPAVAFGQVSRSNHPSATLPQQTESSVSVEPDVLRQYDFESGILGSTITIHYAEPELSWFLAPDSWEIQHDWISTTRHPSSLFKCFVSTVRDWLRDWATRGHNVFIHRELYKPGLPCYLEAAYTTLLTYLAKTEETEDMVLQIVENRASGLCQQSVLLEEIETFDAKTHLSRTQALLVYTLIRLFDGCPRQRALAEDSLRILYQWCNQMREAAIAEARRLSEELALLAPGDESLELAIWRAWILSESVRRTWMIVSSTVNIYQTKKDGWADCAGILLFTTRQGLWETPSAWRWAQQVRNQGPLFTQSVNLMQLMEEASPAEIDAFTNHILSIVHSPEQRDRWVAKTAQIEERCHPKGCWPKILVQSRKPFE